MSLDLKVDNYSIDDLMLLFGGVNVQSSISDINKSADALIQKFTNTGNPEIADFFRDALRIVIEYVNKNSTPIVVDTILTSLWKNDPLDDSVWNNRTLIDEELKAEVNKTPFRGAILAEKTYEPPSEKKFSITTQEVIIDSQFRPNILPYSDNPRSNSFNTNFSFYLSRSSSKTISLTLNSITIPTSWKTCTVLLGNTFFTYNGHVIVIPDGNYTPDTMVTTINGLTETQYGLQISFYRERFIFKNTLPYLVSPLLTFFIKKNMTNIDECGFRSSSGVIDYKTFGVNSTLGWLLGFHITPNNDTGDVSVYLEPGVEQIAQSSPNLYGSKYFVLSLEEYSNQRLTKGLSNIVSGVQRKYAGVSGFYPTIKAECLLKDTALTHSEQSVLETVVRDNNASTENVLTLSTYKIAGYNAASAFAVIPLDAAIINNNRGKGIPYQLSVDKLGKFKRNYKTPTIIEKIAVSLTDDKGNLVNLCNADWAFNITIEEQN